LHENNQIIEQIREINYPQNNGEQRIRIELMHRGEQGNNRINDNQRNENIILDDT
jgi:hypothetical protein